MVLKMLRILSLVLMGMLTASYPSEAQQVPRINCGAPHQRDLNLTPIGDGPLQLRAVYCQIVRTTLYPSNMPMVSPDGQSIAYLENDAILRIAQLDNSDGWIDYRTKMGVFSRFGRSGRSRPAVAWASNSKSVWAANHDAVMPSGFATSPLQPLKTVDDGSILTLPPLQHEAGPLDGLLWAGGDGLAVAQFGTRGGYYRPEHPDPNPSFAIVDAQRGLVRDTLAFSAIEALKDRAKGSPHAAITDAAATRLRDGKVRTLLNVGRWVVWTEGQAPVTITDPYADDFYSHSHIVMSPDGSRVLVARFIGPREMICERRPRPDCGTRDPPVEGVIAAMHDLEDGRLLWSIRATVSYKYEGPPPAISPDGRFALIELPPEGDRPLIALVALEDGRIVQTIPAPSGYFGMGFARDGQSVWTHAHGLTALYDVQSHRQQ
ncbi:PD40 domain-containing protein [Bradyrhizobium icense]|uniref:Uncharacterized protein n=1 Tax=Bradyrhizobium icense TaxID=1274631 RepID=A0A1B1UNK0_9BRAD|nr:PD40 domain-containing protein [Bradyrhizobium icense]ANW04305.1 hypothetical protein LMTR13_33355 [Bradyrhizobium icense]